MQDLNVAFIQLNGKFLTVTSKSVSDSSQLLNKFWSEWKQIFLDISNKHAPFKTAQLKNRYNKWISSDIIKLMYKRDYCHKKAIKSNDPTRSNDFWQTYRQTRNLVTKSIKNAKLSYNNEITNKYRKSCGNK